MTTTPALRALRPTEVVSKLTQCEGWQLAGSQNTACVEKTFQFPGYFETIAFVNAVAFVAQSMQHHPELVVGFRHCTVRYRTHDVQGISQLDFDAAQRVDALLSTH